jgi:AcrR family transcriptional regulator
MERGLAKKHDRSYCQIMRQTHSTTRSKIIDLGVDLLSQVGLNGITIGGLAGEMGMSKSGLFAHFHSKDAIQVALLEQTVALADANVVAPAMEALPGLPRLRALFTNWLGWSAKAGLRGGCPVAAGLFELDDMVGETRTVLKTIEARWREILSEQTAEAIALGQLDEHLDIEQFVWELCGIYLSHHASARFLRDPFADRRAMTAFDALLARATRRPERH